MRGISYNGWRKLQWGAYVTMSGISYNGLRKLQYVT